MVLLFSFDAILKNEQVFETLLSSKNHVQSTLNELEAEDARAEEEHQARLNQIHEEVRLALFKRSGLKENVRQIFLKFS